LGSANVLPSETRDLLRQLLTSTDRQGVLGEIRTNLGSVGPLIAALLALFGLRTAARKAPEIGRQAARIVDRIVVLPTQAEREAEAEAKRKAREEAVQEAQAKAKREAQDKAESQEAKLVYDQARIEAESVKAICQKYQDSTDPAFRTRALIIKEQRSELVKHHLWVLWTDYFKPPHFEKYPQLHSLFNEATKLAGATGTKGSADVAKADELLAKIEEIGKIFWETKQG